MGDKVWLVRAGCYSDQWIVGAFSTEQKADEYAEAYNGQNRDDAYVDEYELDTEFIPEGLKGWEVALSSGGDVLSIERREKLVRSCVRITAAGMFVECFARDEEHAKKIATEKRQEEAARAVQRHGKEQKP